MPHPDGYVEVRLKRKNDKIKGEVILPKGTKGTFKWKGKQIQLKEGSQKIEFK